MKRAPRGSFDAIVWHWGRCTVCGQTAYVKESELRRGAAKPGCCGATPKNFGLGGIDPDHAHPAEDTPGHLCHGCMRNANERSSTDMAKVKGKGAPSASKSKANGKGSKAQRSLPAKGANGEERVFKRRYHQDLPCEVDVEFRTAKGRELADVCDEQRAIEDERRTVMAGFRKRLSHVSERAKELSAIVRQGTERKSVQCEDYLLPTNEIETIRLDTGRMVVRRPARADELQLELGGDPTDDADDDEGAPPEPPFGSKDQEKGAKPSPANANGGAPLESTP